MVAPGPRRDLSNPGSREYRGKGARRATGPVVLPLAGCDLPVPDMPSGREWTEHERAMWAELWESGQATQWNDSFVPIVAMYVRITCDAFSGRVTSGLAAEARYYADHLGLSPAGLKTLGWEFERESDGMGELHTVPTAHSLDIDARRTRLTA